MAGEVSRFEDLAAWKLARGLARDSFTVTSAVEFDRARSLRDQMQRAAISIVSNIAEGFERNGNREFGQFLSVAKGSAGELRAQLYIAADIGLIGREDFQKLHLQCVEVSRTIAGLIRYLRNTEYRGSKFLEDSGDATYTTG